MTMRDGQGNYVTNRWLIGILCAVLLMAGGWFSTNIWTEIIKLKEGKVDKEQYCRDVNEIKAGIARIENLHIKRNGD